MYLTIPLNAEHKKQNFDCGVELLNRYIHKQAKQDVRRHLAACFVMVKEGDFVAGYYTLSSAAIHQGALPDEISKKLPKSYKKLPVILLGRLAVERSLAGKGYGAKLLIDALRRSYEISSKIGSMAVVVDPIDDKAESFYHKMGFAKLLDTEKMFLPMKTISCLFNK